MNNAIKWFGENTAIGRWWMALEPPTQYMYWIIAFCVMLMSGIGLMVWAFEYTGYASMEVLIAVLLGIGLFLMFFMFVVLWLTIHYPNLKENDER